MKRALHCLHVSSTTAVNSTTCHCDDVYNNSLTSQQEMGARAYVHF